MKTCITCGAEKPVTDFHADKRRKDGRVSSCKPCKNAYRKKYHEENREKLCARAKDWYWSNRDRARKAAREWREKNIDYSRAKRKEQYWSDPESARKASVQYTLDRLQTDPLFRFKMRCRKRIWAAFNENGYSKKTKSFELIGCTPDELVEHIESQFTDGMGWHNYGEWHVDHIIPFASATCEEGVARLCHYTNLQPLWAVDNIRKSARL